jgi:hypothetical protein
MAHVVTINRPEVVAMIEEAAGRLTSGNKTAAVALALRQLLDRETRKGSLFGTNAGSVRVQEGYDLTSPTLDLADLDAYNGRRWDH